jgi:hypothetical protein
VTPTARNTAPGKARLARKGRAAFAWALLFFAAAQLLLTAAMERWRPEWRDREYGRKLACLRECLAHNPGRPLALMLGSSRTVYGFQADRCDELWGPDGERCVGFNFGVAAAGPLKEDLCLRALLDEGIRPDLLLVEVLPPMLNEPGPDRFCEENWLYAAGLSATDLARALPYTPRPGRMLRGWARSRLVPCHAHRERLLASWLGPECVPEARTRPLERMSGCGWIAAEWQTVSPEKRRDETDFARRQYARVFEDFRIGERPARALRDLLARCRAEKITVALVLMPEGSEFRGWYPPAMVNAVDDFLAELKTAYGVAVIDARTWVADGDFWDSHHLLPSGAAAFSRRLAEEVSGVLGGPHDLASGPGSPPEHD